MNVVEVAVALPKIGDGGGPLVTSHRRVVAAETKREILLAERRVELFWIFGAQKTKMSRTVGLVAAGTVLLADRAVVVRVLGQQLLHVPERRPIAIHVPVVALQTGRNAVRGQQTGSLGRVRIVAIQTRLGLLDRRVLHLGLVRHLADSGVAGIAQGGQRRLQLIALARSMRVVAAGTAAFQGLVAKTCACQPRRDFFMTGGAGCLSRLPEQVRLIRSVGIMAGHARAHRHRAVHELAREFLLFVARQAELLGGIRERARAPGCRYRMTGLAGILGCRVYRLPLDGLGVAAEALLAVKGRMGRGAECRGAQTHQGGWHRNPRSLDENGQKNGGNLRNLVTSMDFMSFGSESKERLGPFFQDCTHSTTSLSEFY